MSLMKRSILWLVLVLLPWQIGAQSLPARSLPTLRWAAYYGNDTNQDFSAYQLVVLHHKHDLPVRQINSPQKTMLAYISAGEGGPDQPDYTILKERELLMPNNHTTHWPGTLLIDVRKPEWTAYLVEELIPQILAEGFDGIMLDTIDSLIDAEKRDPVQCAGMSQATIDMVQTIRAHYPEISIMVNRGFDILPNIAGNIDFLLAESIFADYHKDGPSTPFPPEVYDSIAAMLTQTKATFPHLQLLTLDYWPLDDKDGVRKVYAAQRGKGFTPYVGTYDLTSVVPEPK